MKINEVTNNKRLDEFWPQVVAGAVAVGKVGSKLFSKTPKKTTKINKTDKADFDDIPLPQKVTGKVHTDPKMGNTNKWKKDSNLHIQDMATKVRQGN
jgi:hypothetical protein